MKRRKFGSNINVLEAAVGGTSDPVYGGCLLLLGALVNKIVMDAPKGNASADDLDLADSLICGMGGESARCLDGLKPTRYPAQQQIELPETAPRRAAPRRASQVIQLYNVRTGALTTGVM